MFVVPDENKGKHAKTATTADNTVIPVSALCKKAPKNTGKNAEINQFYPVVNTVRALFNAEKAEKQRILDILDELFPPKAKKWAFPTPDKNVNKTIAFELIGIPSQLHLYDEILNFEETGRILLKPGNLNEFKDYDPEYGSPLYRFYDNDSGVKQGLTEGETYGAKEYWKTHAYNQNQWWYEDYAGFTEPIDVVYLHEKYVESTTKTVDITQDALKATVALIKHLYPKQIAEKTIDYDKAEDLLRNAGYIDYDLLKGGENYMDSYRQSGIRAFEKYMREHGTISCIA